MPELKKEIYSENSKQGSGLCILLRIFWMVFGNLILFLIAFTIYEDKKAVLNLRDGIYWIIVLLLIIVRYIDIKYLDGLTAMGSPASMSHWYRYVVGLVICTGLLWGLAHLLNYFTA